MSWTATFRGVTIGAGTSYRWVTMPSGLDVIARQAVTAGLYGGLVPLGRDVPESTDVTFTVHLLGSTPTEVQTLRDTLAAAWAPSSSIADDELEELTLTLATGDRIIRGRPASCAFNLDRIAVGSLGQAQCVFARHDPLWYGDIRSVSVAVGDTSGGMVTPMDTPMVTTGSGSTGDAVVVNNGTAPARWTATLTGGTAGVQSPRLMLGGRTVQLDGLIQPGSLATVDSETGTVEVDGQPRSWVVYGADWWDIPPGTSTFSYRAASGDGTATLTWRDASY